MDGYILTTTKNTFGWVEYDNDISLDYKEFLKGERLLYKDLPLFYNIPKSSNLKKIRSAVLLESTGPELVCRQFKEVLETQVQDIQFFDVDLFCGNEKIDGFYAMNVPHLMKCIDLENSEFRLMNFDRNNPDYMFYYMKLRRNLFDNNKTDIVRCEEMHRSIVVSEKIKTALFAAGLNGLQFSDSIDMTPKERTIYERI
ncbi:imm11 family protein [Prevotella jejuni]